MEAVWRQRRARTREGAVKGGCQGWWRQRHVQGSGNPLLWLGTRESGARAGDMWVAEEKVWVGPGSVDCGQGMHPRRRVSLSWSAMGHVPCDACVTCHWQRCWQQEWQSQA